MIINPSSRNTMRKSNSVLGSRKMDQIERDLFLIQIWFDVNLAWK